mmetsp:Transcript_23216/g.75522  ORF Transcript_23216/g.75522 Transcript_23216/m.75522 type:complete len:336 (+) Transcript_23216:82-1089(+)
MSMMLLRLLLLLALSLEGCMANRAQLGRSSVANFAKIRHIESRNFFEAGIFSRCYEIGCVRRESLKFDDSIGKNLESSGTASQSFRQHYNKAWQSVIPKAENMPPSFEYSSLPETSGTAPGKGYNFQCDMCLSFNQDVYLCTLFKDIVDDPGRNVRSVTPGGSAPFTSVLVRTNHYICFEITEAPEKLFEKIYQLSRVSHVLKSDVIGKEAQIAATGIFVNGDQAVFDFSCEKVQEFLVKAAEDDKLGKLFNWEVPIFLIHTPYRNLFTAIEEVNQNLNESIEAMRSEIKERDQKMRSRIKERDQKIRSEIRNISSEINQSLSTKLDQIINLMAR